jgi:hypothetical protein
MGYVDSCAKISPAPYTLTTPLGPWYFPPVSMSHYNTTIRRTVPVYVLINTPRRPSTRSLRQPHLVPGTVPPTQKVVFPRTASYQQRTDTLIIASVGSVPPSSLSYPTEPLDVTWNISGCSMSPPHHNYILTFLRLRKYTYMPLILQMISTRYNIRLDDIDFEWQGLSKVLSTKLIPARALPHIYIHLSRSVSNIHSTSRVSNRLTRVKESQYISLQK